MLADDMSKSVINKNLIAIKEYGTRFECSYSDDVSKKYGKLTYWVIGYVITKINICKILLLNL